jgi:hypothetical protein
MVFASTVWDPHTQANINKVESIQCRAARFVTNNYDPRASVTTLLQDLNWPTLRMLRRRKARVEFAFFVMLFTWLFHERFLEMVRPRYLALSTIWSCLPYINKVESIQRRAARFITNNYDPRASVTTLLQDLNWPTLQHRRQLAKLIMMYRITYHLIEIWLQKCIWTNRCARNKLFSTRTEELSTVTVSSSSFNKCIPLSRVLSHWKLYTCGQVNTIYYLSHSI